MTVSHKTGVLNFDVALKDGGTHSFEITSDEAPELEGLAELENGEEVAHVWIGELGVWANIARQIAARGGRCTYRRNKAGGYDIEVIIPPQRFT